jgi:hypothetical protein
VTGALDEAILTAFRVPLPALGPEPPDPCLEELRRLIARGVFGNPGDRHGIGRFDHAGAERWLDRCVR